MQKLLTYVMIAALPLLSLSSCKMDDKVKELQAEEAMASGMQQGYVRVKINEDLAARLERNTDTKTGAVSCIGVKSSDDILSSMGVTSMKRTFPYAGKFEERTRKEGLHLWYDVEFDENMPLTKAKTDLMDIPGVVSVEYRPFVVAPKYKITGIVDGNAPSAVCVQDDKTYPYDDPRLPEQWHYQNYGTVTGTVKGSDINLFPAWENYTKGSDKVIVCVVDGAVDPNHVDLNANMWINEAELNGQEGVDDDGNGYVDDIYGFNYFDFSGTLVPTEHGTHVAGTVSAVNNNGEGVCGVAGGDYANGIKGVRIMSCQIFKDGEKGAKGATAGIKYGADNGAVISQNSWGYDPPLDYIPESDRAAIDYFIKYAGYDENGNQVGPMAGGLVVFAAGNEEKTVGSSSMHENVIAVSAIAGDYKAAYYTNYGTWVDISAPGGDYKKGQEVLSTLPYNKYGLMQGTSMACPHVSGIAALAVSRFGGPGFTWERCRDLILASADPKMYEYNTDQFKGKLGRGLVNTELVLGMGSTIAPDPVKNVKASVVSNKVDFEWTVPSDEDDGVPTSYNVYLSEKELALDFDRANLSEDIKVYSFTNGQLKAGDTFKGTVYLDKFSTRYYYAVDASDLSRNLSEIEAVYNLVTSENNPPKFDCGDIEVSLKNHEIYTQQIGVIDEDGHELTASVETEDKTGSISVSGPTEGKLTLTVDATKTAGGNFSAKLIVTDAYGASSSITVTYIIAPNNAPVKSKDIKNVIMSRQGTVQLDMKEYFSDPDGEELSYRAEYIGQSNVSVRFEGSKMSIAPSKNGTSEIKVIAKDALGLTAESTFKVVVSNSTEGFDVYPNPVVDYLNIRSVDDKNISVVISSASGATVFEGDLKSSAFEPAKIDMKSFKSGNYRLVINSDGKEYKQNIVKL